MNNNATTSYTLNYDLTGGENGPDSASRTSNEHYALFRADSLTPTRQGFVFAGWSFTPDGPAEVFAGDLFTATAQTTTLYAVWTKENTNIPIVGETEVENTEPLGVVATSKDTYSSVTVGTLTGFLVLGLIALIVFAVFRSNRPQIITKEYE